MEIICSTTYDRRVLSAPVRVLCRIIHRTRSRLLRVWCWVLLVLSLLLVRVSWGKWGTVTLNGAVAVLTLATLLGGDAINAFSARRNALPRMRMYTVHFLEEHYETKIVGAVTQWKYNKLLRLAENDHYLVLALGKNHGQLRDKEGVTGAASEELRAFLGKRTGSTVERFRQRGLPLRHRGNSFTLNIKGIYGIQE